MNNRINYKANVGYVGLADSLLFGDGALLRFDVPSEGIEELLVGRMRGDCNAALKLHADYEAGRSIDVDYGKTELTQGIMSGLIGAKRFLYSGIINVDGLSRYSFKSLFMEKGSRRIILKAGMGELR